LYRASTDGYRSSSFHSRCDEAGPTICFVLNEHGKVFGGYVSIDWIQGLRGYKPDLNAFIFSLTDKTKHL